VHANGDSCCYRVCILQFTSAERSLKHKFKSTGFSTTSASLTQRSKQLLLTTIMPGYGQNKLSSTKVDLTLTLHDRLYWGHVRGQTSPITPRSTYLRILLPALRLPSRCDYDIQVQYLWSMVLLYHLDLY
jgi:hypothetical protein